MNRSVKHIGRTMVECVLKDVDITDLKRNSEEKEDVNSPREQRSKGVRLEEDRKMTNGAES